SNLRLPPCEDGTLPLSYAPMFSRQIHHNILLPCPGRGPCTAAACLVLRIVITHPETLGGSPSRSRLRARLSAPEHLPRVSQSSPIAMRVGFRRIRSNASRIAERRLPR